MSEGAVPNGGNQTVSAAGTGAESTASLAPGAAVKGAGPGLAVPADMTAPAAQAAAPGAQGDVARGAPVGPVALAPVQPVAAPGQGLAPQPEKKVDDSESAPRDEEGDQELVLAESDELSDAEPGLSDQIQSLFTMVAQDAAAEPGVGTQATAEESDDDDDENALLIAGGVIAAVGIGAIALGGGGSKDSPPPPPPANRAPVAAADTGVVNEGSSLSSSVATNDSDPDGDTLTYAVSGTAPAGFTLNSNGTYTFDAANAAYNSLAAGQTQQVVVNYTVSDGKGGTASSTLTITVTGTNDAPVAVADTATATEGGAVVTGSVATNDSDPDQNAALTYSLDAPVAGLTLNADGSYSFDPANAAYNSLAAGQTQQVVATYTVSDGQGGAATSTLAITVTGTNDAPVAAADVATATEDGPVVTGSVATNDSDPDQGATLTYSLDAPVPGLTLNADGSYSFDPANAAYDSLPAGQTQQVVASYTVSDGQGGTATSTLTITVTGTNDAAMISGANTGSVTEDGTLTTSGTLVVADVDQGEAELQPTTGGTYGTFTVSANGQWTYTLNNADPAVQALGAGDTLTDTITVTSEDGTDTETITVTINGTNDVATISGTNTGSVTEDGTLTTSGTLVVADVDQGEAELQPTTGGTYGTFTVAADGQWTYALNNADPAVQALAIGETLVDTITVTSEDGADTETITVTINGANDVPVAVDDVNAGDEDTFIAGSVAANDSDVDASDVLTYTLVDPAPAGFVLNADGSYTLDTTDAAYQNLREGETQDVVVNYQVSDGNGGVDVAALTITVTGKVEERSLDVDNDANLATRFVAYDAGATDFSFTDDDDVANTVLVDNFGADDYITFDAPFNGQGSVSFANIDFDGDGLANDLVITTNKGGVVSDIVLRDAVDPSAVIFNEATAEAAIGPGFDNFRSTTQVTVVNQSLDVDNDNNIGSRYTLPVAANTATFVFTDDDDIANTVRVADFGADDTIIFDAPVGNVSFANIDNDGDGLANDLAITVNKNGVVSDIILANSVDPNSVIFDEATAEAEIGAGTDNFQFSAVVPPPPPPPPVGQTSASLDFDNDGNLATYATIDAGLDGFTFNDDSDVANTVQIINFGTDDRIVFEAGNVYGFANIDFDGDGLANDLSITLNKGGVVSDIIIKDVVDPNAVVFDEATAEQAMGNIDYFSFA